MNGWCHMSRTMLSLFISHLVFENNKAINTILSIINSITNVVNTETDIN